MMDITDKLTFGISTNTLLAEGDGALAVQQVDGSVISTNTLLAEGDHPQPVAQPHSQAISTNTLLAEGDAPANGHNAIWVISTNTLLAEGDTARLPLQGQHLYFNQHPPRGG